MAALARRRALAMWAVARAWPTPRLPECSTSHSPPVSSAHSSRKWLPEPKVPNWRAALRARSSDKGVAGRWEASQASARAPVPECPRPTPAGTAASIRVSNGSSESGRSSTLRSSWAATIPQPMSTPTAEGITAPSVGMTEPTVAPMPTWASGMRATGPLTTGRRAQRSAWARVCRSTSLAQLISLSDTWVATVLPPLGTGSRPRGSARGYRSIHSGPAARLGRDLAAGPVVVGLARWRARYVVHPGHLLGQLVAGQLAPAEADQLGQGYRAGPGAGRHQGHHLLAPAGRRAPHDHGVGHRRVGLESGLDLLGVDLLAPGVDAKRPPAQQPDGPVRLHRGHVAGDGPAAAVDLHEGGSRALGVLVVGEGDVAGGGQPPHLAGAGDDGAQLLVQHHGGAGPGGEAQRRRGPAGALPHGHRLDRGLRGADRLADGQHAGQAGQQGVLDL